MGGANLYITVIKSHDHHSVVDYKGLFLVGKVGKHGKMRLLIYSDVSAIQMSVFMLPNCYYL